MHHLSAELADIRKFNLTNFGRLTKEGKGRKGTSPNLRKLSMNSEKEVEKTTEEVVERVGQGIRQVLLAKDAEILHLRSEVAGLKATVANLKANAPTQPAVDMVGPGEAAAPRGPDRPRARMVTDEPNVQLTSPGRFVTIIPPDSGNRSINNSQPTNVGLHEAEQKLATDVLLCLKETPGQTIGHIAKQLNLVPSQLTNLLGALRKQGLVRTSGQKRGMRYYIA